jgi:ribosomal protein S18 acetylase RimI-like enzyme
MDLPSIRIAEPSERERIISTLLMGFSADPLTRWFWPEASTYLQAATALDAFGGNAFEAGGAFVTADFEGAALWLPPGVHPDEERMAAFMGETVHPDIADEVFRVFELMDEFHPEEDVWYLPLIAVDPAHQGRGLGSALMKEALRCCDEAGLPAYLESSNPKNISLYERQGFETVGVIQHGRSPVVTPMYRQAQ